MNQKISKEIKELVIARLEVMPSNMKVSIGSYGTFSKEDLKKHVEEEDAVGKKVIEVQMAFLRAIKEGKLYKQN
ncbi:MAG: hypothetical protein KGI27_12650 [Thaumarchaeota archaeon]|nr:hypothetical protein [Nitrososphaerota archaeon]